MLVNRSGLVNAGLVNAGMIRTGGSFNPLSLSPALWLKADAGTYQTSGGSAATADGDPVGEWQDQSGNGRHAGQTTGTKRGALKLAIQNGRSVIRFDGTDDYYAIALTLGQPITLFVAMRQATNRVVLDGDDGTDRILWYRPSGGQWQAYAGAGLDGEAGENVFHCHSVVYNGGSSQIWRDGSSQATGNVGSLSWSGVTLGDVYTRDGSNALNGDVGEILIYGSALSDANRQLVEGYLRTRWGTP